MASNAKVNEDKSQAFLFAGSHGGNGNLTADGIPFPVIGQSSAEIVHLSYPFQLDGSVLSKTIAKQLSTIQTKVNILTLMNTTLAAQARICNSFLLSKLWHALCLCPLPLNLQQRVIAIINPFLFKGWHHWIKQEYVVAPRYLGGLGVIDTMQMGVALLGQMVAGLLASTEPIGAQFRQALQDHLWIQYGVLPAHFILKHGQPWIQMVSIITTQRSFMCQVIYTLTQLRLTIEPDWETISVPELLSLPFYNNMFGFTWPDIHVASQQSWEHNGLWVWGDILWYNTNEKGKTSHTNMVTLAYPLVPPSASGIMSNYVDHSTDASTTSSIDQLQVKGALPIIDSAQEDTSDHAPALPVEQCDNGNDEVMENLYLAEPNQQAFQSIFTGRLVWSSLQCVLVGPALPHNALALKILDIPQANTPTTTTRYVAQSLKAYVQVHDVWICQVSYHDGPTPPADTNVYIALISTPAGDEGGLDLVQLRTIPGYIWILTNDCELNYVGASHDAGNTNAAIQQAEEDGCGANNLDYGT
ncbi:uncharacterized protein UBRO2_00132 [Ustilago bromivora]|uniref:Uncharacterized protein n=1 Tax=Ustilago bromivora TaxID=307758 RepID=A0A8H8TPS7_9BASI|nr:uncharacterized protein UBRO2_00132 [Ustilago bromivora]